jgi:hypothetical protein
MIKMRLDNGQIEVVEDVIAEIYRKKTPLERLKIAFGLWRSARIQLFNCIKSLHPDWNERQIQQEVVRRISHGSI